MIGNIEYAVLYLVFLVLFVEVITLPFLYFASVFNTSVTKIITIHTALITSNLTKM